MHKPVSTIPAPKASPVDDSRVIACTRPRRIHSTEEPGMELIYINIQF